jgi:hypothetical protein
MSSAESAVEDAARWLTGALVSARYGEIGVRFVLHGGRITRIERTLVQKVQTVSEECELTHQGCERSGSLLGSPRSSGEKGTRHE